MTDKDLDIVRYLEGAMTAKEQAAFEKEHAADPALRQSVRSEEAIDRILQSDANRLNTEISVPTEPGAPLTSRISTVSVTTFTRFRVITMIAGSAIIVGVAFYFLFSNINTPSVVPSAHPAVTQPAPIPVPPALKATTGDSSSGTASSHESTSAQPRSSQSTSKKQHKPAIDLDKDIAPPNVFNDTKGHMPLRSK